MSLLSPTRRALTSVVDSRAPLPSRSFGTTAAVQVLLRQRGQSRLTYALPRATSPASARHISLLAGPKPRSPAADPPSEVSDDLPELVSARRARTRAAAMLPAVMSTRRSAVLTLAQDLLHDEMRGSWADTDGLEALAKRAESVTLDASAITLYADGRMIRTAAALGASTVDLAMLTLEDKASLISEYGLVRGPSESHS